MKAPVGHKEIHFEDVIEAHLLGNDWLPIDLAGFGIDIGLHADELMTFVEQTQPKAWGSVVGRHGGEEQARERFLARVVGELDKRGTVDVLRHGVKEVNIQFALMFPRPASTLNPDAAELYAANRCGVARQFRYEDVSENTVDLALFVNGIPVATAELKNQLTGQTHDHAIKQYEQDRDPINVSLGRRCVVHFAVDPDWVFFTTRLAGPRRTRWFPFNRGSEPGGEGGKGNYPDPAGGHRTAYLWRDVWQRDAWLEILQRYLHVKQEDGRPDTLIFPRFHQWDVSRTLLGDARARGAGQSYLVQHSAGSGKSNSIAWLAHGLSSLHGADDEPVFNKVVVITDRKVLDQQLQKTIYQFEHRHGVVERVDGTSQQLLDALQGAEARIIITTLQKFPVVLGKLQETGDSLAAGRRYAVIVDEAHSSQTGETARALKQVLGDAADIDKVDEPIEVVLDHPPREGDGDDALESAAQATAIREQREEQAGLTDAAEAIARVLAARGQQPNMSFFAFTATPKARTLELFGEDRPGGTKGPFHVYSMRQAIEEGFILDVLQGYTTYETFLKLQNADQLDRVEVDKRKASAKLARFTKLHPYALGQRAEIVVEHFREHVKPRLKGKAKAMVVTDSRLHAVRYKLAIDKYLDKQGYDDLRTLVAFSGDLEDPYTGETYHEAGMNGFAETELPRRFAGDDYQVLIVAEKYQTGFDQPLLVAMYVDKKLEGVNAVQTLSRLNRIYPPLKDRTFVLDFVNSAENIQESFAPFYRGTIAESTDPNLIFDTADRIWAPDVLRREEVDAYAERIYAGGGSDDHGTHYALTDNALERWRALDEDGRERFRDAAITYIRAYSFLSQVVSWIDVDQEKLYAFAKTLLARLDRPDGSSGADIDMTGIELTHYRMQGGDEQRINLDTGEVEPLTSFPGGAAGRTAEVPVDLLGEIVRRFNERFGTEFTEADKILRYVAAREAKQETTRDRANANDFETFKLNFARERLALMWLEAKGESQEFFETVMNASDADKAALDDAMMREVWERARSQDIEGDS